MVVQVCTPEVLAHTVNGVMAVAPLMKADVCLTLLGHGPVQLD